MLNFQSTPNIMGYKNDSLFKRIRTNKMGCIQQKEVPSTVTTTSTSLENCTYENCRTFIPTFTQCKCVKVYDGDTLHIVGIVNGKPYRFTSRMYGYDSPEMKSSNPDEKKSAQLAKVFLENRVAGKTLNVYIHPIHEKYGRLLVTLSDDQGEINKWMVENGHGKPYFGGTKEK